MTLEQDLQKYMSAMSEMMMQYTTDTMSKYFGLIAQAQFEVLKTEDIYDIASGSATIPLSRKITQFILFDRIFYSVPSTSTSLIITLGNIQIPVYFAAGIPTTNTILFQKVLGPADTISATVTPLPGANVLWGFGLFGKKTGNTQQI